MELPYKRRHATLALLRARLIAWERENEFDHYNMAHLADRAIALIRDEIVRAGSSDTGGGAE